MKRKPSRKMYNSFSFFLFFSRFSMKKNHPTQYILCRRCLFVFFSSSLSSFYLTDNMLTLSRKKTRNRNITFRFSSLFFDIHQYTFTYETLFLLVKEKRTIFVIKVIREFQYLFIFILFTCMM